MSWGYWASWQGARKTTKLEPEMLLASLLPRRRNALKAGKTQTFHGMESGVMATKTTIWRRLGSLMMVIHVHAHDIVVSRMVHWRGSRILEMIQFNHKLRVMTPNVVKQLNFVNVVVGPCCFLRKNHFQFALERVKQILSYYILFHLSAWFHDLYIYISISYYISYENCFLMTNGLCALCFLLLLFYDHQGI